MTTVDVYAELKRLPHEHFVSFVWPLLDQWKSLDLGIEVVEPILRFMEGNPSIDYGTPGPLVHFVERFYGKGYEQKLVESVSRNPTSHTTWMFCRLIDPMSPEADGYIDLLRKIALRTDLDDGTRLQIDSVLWDPTIRERFF